MDSPLVKNKLERFQVSERKKPDFLRLFPSQNMKVKGTHVPPQCKINGSPLGTHNQVVPRKQYHDYFRSNLQ